jgi:hypothetical protein
LCYAEKRTRHSPAAQSFQFLALFRRSWRDSKSESSAFATTAFVARIAKDVDGRDIGAKQSFVASPGHDELRMAGTS